MTAFWNIAPSGLVEADALMTEAVRTFKSSVYFSTRVHSAVSQKAVTFFLAAVKPRNMTFLHLYFPFPI
jgi:hypothetical protein